jgi:hypothetical protein
MKIGIEEEFLVIDPDTLFYTPSAPRLANSLVYKNKNYIKKSSVELPLNSGIFKFIRQAKKGYCVIEIKTNPYNEIEKLKNELDNLRRDLIDVAEENGLYLIPTGVHPMFLKNENFADNCAALHIHIQSLNKKTYNRILGNVPFLISISTNSPFYEGKVMAMSSRAQISNHISSPKNHFDRESDLLINNSLKTIEIRILDTQITSDETIGLSSIYRTIAQNNLFYKNITREEYDKLRQQSILNGRGGIKLNKERYNILASADKYSKKVLETENGSNWQINIYKKYGMGSVIQSLWESFKLNKRTIKTTTKKIDIENVKKYDLFYLLPYFPFFMIEKIKKYFQDITPIKNIKHKEDVFDNRNKKE